MQDNKVQLVFMCKDMSRSINIFDKDETIINVKKYISENTGYSIDDFWCTCNGNVLMDDKRLSDYKTSGDFAVITVNMRLRRK